MIIYNGNEARVGCCVSVTGIKLLTLHYHWLQQTLLEVIGVFLSQISPCRYGTKLAIYVLCFLRATVNVTPLKKCIQVIIVFIC